MLNKKKNVVIVMGLFGLLLIENRIWADNYPGDNIYSNIVQEVYHEVSSDNISLSFDGSISNRTQLCDKLTTQHNTGTPGSAPQTNAVYLGETISLNTCLNALWYSSGYTSSAGWSNWSGTLSGTWYDINGNEFNDPATWATPITKTANSANDVDSNGARRVYDFQKVTFSGRSGNSRFGWNQSHSEVAYVWGWDPKDNSNQNGRRGTHVGWTFTQNQTNCIVWVTPEEAFLECLKPICTGKRRTSAGLFGIGQWTIGNTTACREKPRKSAKELLLEKSKPISPFHKAPIKSVPRQVFRPVIKLPLKLEKTDEPKK